MQPATGNTPFTVTARSYDEVWTAAIRSVTRNLTIIDESKIAGRIRAKSNAGLMSGDDVVGVFISPAGRNAPSYTIEVQNLIRSRGLISGPGPDWTRNIVAGINAELANMAPAGPVSIKDSLSPSEEILTMPAPEGARPTGLIKSGELSAQVEQLSRQSGCVPTGRAKLIAKTAGVETYQTSCQNSQQALFKCEMRQCRRLD